MAATLPAISAAPGLPSGVSRVRDLVLRYGWNPTAYQILNPGIAHWLPAGRPAVVGYVRAGRRWVAAGAPVCDGAALAGEAAAFEEDAARDGCRVCYFCAMDRLRDVLTPSGGGGGPDGRTHASLAIGAQPVWDPRGWDARLRGRASLRAQVNRARNKGVTVVVPPVRPAPYRGALQRCLAEWLDARPMPPLHFLVEPDTLGGVLADRRLYVALCAGRPVAFLVASPVPLRNGYLIEQIARGAGCPNGTAELLVGAAMRDLAAGGATYVTAGLVALANHARDAMAANPMWVRVLAAWARAHGRRFYNFAGLEAFRAKMDPDAWETVYAVANEPRFTPATLHAVARAFSRQPPTVALARALGRAARQELRWLTGTR